MGFDLGVFMGVSNLTGDSLSVLRHVFPSFLVSNQILWNISFPSFDKIGPSWIKSFSFSEYVIAQVDHVRFFHPFSSISEFYPVRPSEVGVVFHFSNQEFDSVFHRFGYASPKFFFDRVSLLGRHGGGDIRFDGPWSKVVVDIHVSGEKLVVSFHAFFCW